jgi:hypothetical protein
MGNSSSKKSATPRCPNCAYSAKAPRQVGENPVYFICSRCHGLMADGRSQQPQAGSKSSNSLNPLSRIPASSSSSSSSSSGSPYETLSGRPPTEESIRLPLDRIHLAPFLESLPEEHRIAAGSINYEETMIESYLKEFFAQAGERFPGQQSLFVQAGSRFQIQGVDFKVLATYPPSGYVTPRTSVRCLTKPLSALASIAKMHVLPVLATMPGEKNAAGEWIPAPMEGNELFKNYIRPWIQHSAPTAPLIAGAARSAAASSSSSAAASSSSSSSSASSSSSSSHTASSSSSSSSSPDHEPRHICEGDLFVASPPGGGQPIQFKIISALPTNGVLGPESEIFSNGPPLVDLEKVQIQPIFETLPNSEKNWDGGRFFRKYLMPYFQGRFQFLRRGDAIEIDGVTFKCQACEPISGLVTSDTLIFNEGPPLRAEDLRRQQELDDELMARNMQIAEDQQNRASMGLMGGGGGGAAALGLGGQVTTPAELRARLAQVLRMMNANDPHRSVVQRLYDSLGQFPPNQALHTPDRGMANLFRAAGAQAAAQENRGARQDAIEALPTRMYHAPQRATDALPEADDDRVKCLVCMSEYEEGEELRTCQSRGDIITVTSCGFSCARADFDICMLSTPSVPCFHSYHVSVEKPHAESENHSLDDSRADCPPSAVVSPLSSSSACIDEWLHRNKICPQCRLPVHA